VQPTFKRNATLTAENERLAVEVGRRDRKITELAFLLQKERDDYAVSLAGLNDSLKKLDKFYTDLRVIAGFKLDARAAKKLGTGGPTLSHDEFLSALCRLDDSRFAAEASRCESRLQTRCLASEKEFLIIKRLLERRRSLLADVPDACPVKGIITSYYGARRGRRVHGGLDIAAAPGTPVRAPADGVVVVAGPYPYYGVVVFLDHGGGFTTRYGHLSATEVKVGDRVERGDIIGRVGATGWATGNHLHYEVRVNNVTVDPYNYLGEKLPVKIVDGSKLNVVEIPDDADMLISDEVYAEYERKKAAEPAPENGAPPAGEQER
jgi:murein DD-endopeptidase MepM/ murein hydrolase activator NlpD